MQSTAQNVTDYLAEAPADRRLALARLRELCLATLTGFEESMAYGNPAYARNGDIEGSFASQKHFIGLYILRNDVMDAFRDRLKARGVSLGKGCIRYSKPEKIDFELVEAMLKAAQASTGMICG